VRNKAYQKPVTATISLIGQDQRRLLRENPFSERGSTPASAIEKYNSLQMSTEDPTPESLQ